MRLNDRRKSVDERHNSFHRYPRLQIIPESFHQSPGHHKRLAHHKSREDSGVVTSGGGGTMYRRRLLPTMVNSRISGFRRFVERANRSGIDGTGSSAAGSRDSFAFDVLYDGPFARIYEHHRPG